MEKEMRHFAPACPSSDDHQAQRHLIGKRSSNNWARDLNFFGLKMAFGEQKTKVTFS